MENVNLRVNRSVAEELEKYLMLNRLQYEIKHEGKGVFDFTLPGETQIPSLPHKGVLPSLN